MRHNAISPSLTYTRSNVVHNMAVRADHIGETDAFDMSGNNNYVHDVSVENGDECVTVKTPTNVRALLLIVVCLP